jgi:hypothetical protein
MFKYQDIQATSGKFDAENSGLFFYKFKGTGFLLSRDFQDVCS